MPICVIWHVVLAGTDHNLVSWHLTVIVPVRLRDIQVVSLVAVQCRSQVQFHQHWFLSCWKICYFFFNHLKSFDSKLIFWTKITLRYPSISTNQLLNLESMLIQRWASTFNHPQCLIIGSEMSWKCNNDQPKINFSITIQPKITQVWSCNIKVGQFI